jgi:hypothetical protein
MKAHIDGALKQIELSGFRIVKVVFYWSQGEQDRLGGSTQAAYEATFRPLLNRIRTDFPGSYFLIERLGNNRANSSPTAAAAIRAAQTAVAADSTYSSWVKVCSTLAEGFTLGGGSADYSDDLHYSQAAYNSLGTQMATDGLTFAHANGLLSAPNGTKYAHLLAHLPPVGNWYRMKVTLSGSGAWALTMLNDPIPPYSVTLYDTTGENGVDATQATSWSFAGAGSKDVYIYAHSSTGSSLQLTGQASSRLTDITVIDEGFPLTTITGSAGWLDTTVALADTDLYRLSGSKMRSISLAFSSPNFSTGLTFTDVTLAKLSGLTSLDVTRSPVANLPMLDLTLVPNITNFRRSVAGLSTANVNTILAALVANNKNNGTLVINQFLSSVYSPAPPSGQGITDKATLISRGWGVTTD